jgi:hypothetical protein
MLLFNYSSYTALFQQACVDIFVNYATIVSEVLERRIIVNADRSIKFNPGVREKFSVIIENLNKPEMLLSIFSQKNFSLIEPYINYSFSDSHYKFSFVKPNSKNLKKDILFICLTTTDDMSAYNLETGKIEKIKLITSYSGINKGILINHPTPPQIYSDDYKGQIIINNLTGSLNKKL